MSPVQIMNLVWSAKTQSLNSITREYLQQTCPNWTSVIWMIVICGSVSGKSQLRYLLCSPITMPPRHTYSSGGKGTRSRNFSTGPRGARMSVGVVTTPPLAGAVLSATTASSTVPPHATPRWSATGVYTP